MKVLGSGQIREEPDHEEDMRPDEDPLACLGPASLTEDLGDRVRHGDEDAGHSLSPVAISAACQRSKVSTISAIRPRIRSASPRWLPLNRSGRCTLRIQKAEITPTRTSTTNTSTRNANQPWCPSHGSESPLGDGADQRHHDRREEDEESPEDEGVDQAGAETLEQLLLAEYDDRLVAYPLRHIVEPGHRLAEADELRQHECAAGEEETGDAEDEEEREGGDGCSHAAEPRRQAEACRHQPATGRAAPRGDGRTATGFSRSSGVLTPAASAARPTPPAAPRAGRRRRRSPPRT